MKIKWRLGLLLFLWRERDRERSENEEKGKMVGGGEEDFGSDPS